MTFLIGLVHHVDAPTVAEFVEIFAVGIMAGAQEVDIPLLHQSDVLLVGSIIHVATSTRMVVVSVHTPQFHVLAIDFKHLANTLHTFHSEMVFKLFIVLTILHAKQLHGKRIEPGLLCRPQPR